MAKRPNLLASIDMGTKANDPAPSVVPMPAQKVAKTPETVKTSLYLPSKAHYKLKEIALVEGCKAHDLVIEGINKLLTEKGFPSVEELGKK